MRKKIAAALIIVVVLVLFLPLAKGTCDDGSRVYSALTYKIIVWNKLYAEPNEDGKTYTYCRTSVYWFPDSVKKIDDLWTIERGKR